MKTLDIFLQLQAGTKAMSMRLHLEAVKTNLSWELWESTPKGELFETEFSVEGLLGVLKGMVSSVGEVLGLGWEGDSAVIGIRLISVDLMNKMEMD